MSGKIFSTTVKTVLIDTKQPVDRTFRFATLPIILRNAIYICKAFYQQKPLLMTDGGNQNGPKKNIQFYVHCFFFCFFCPGFSVKRGLKVEVDESRRKKPKQTEKGTLLACAVNEVSPLLFFKVYFSSILSLFFDLFFFCFYLKRDRKKRGLANREK